ncbi:TraI domain-containing protein [Xenorhabdus budapestensis]|uniref:TraI domain-containing protein n=1 Tax=Xenorhabdus budapestensis TaxID=290110 RepID=A0ABX7VJA5_XENBU|nr:TraI domain-containing protein [Xenorhabdus budapestensis]QTL40854.1 TraI domain-containing protein [Xenorhabdus budapestensis]
MFTRFKSHFTRSLALQKKSSGQKTSEACDNGGYFRPQSVDALLATPLRCQCLQQLWQNSTLPEGLYQRFYLAPIKQLLGSVQQIPAAPEGKWSGSGGFADLTLQFTTCAVRLAKGHLLPPGVAPETQAAQGVLWQAVVFWAALFYHLPLLRQLEGELEDGRIWQPGIGIPDKPFRFRFRAPENIPSAPQEVLLAACLLPETTFMPPVSEITTPPPSVSDDTLTLLSLFQSTDGASQQNKGKNHHHDLKMTKRPGREKESIATDSHRHSSFKDK